MVLCRRMMAVRVPEKALRAGRRLAMAGVGLTAGAWGWLGQAVAQTSFLAPDGHNRFPAVTIFCPSGTGVAPCTFGGGGGAGGAVSISLSNGAVTASNRFPVVDPVLDGLVSGGALTVGGSVSLAGSPVVSLGAGGNAIGAVSVSNFPASQAITGAVGQSGSWSVGLASGASVAVSALPALPAGSNAIGAVSVSNFPASQAVTAAALPLPAGAATAAGQSAPLGPVAPGAGTATASTMIGCVSNTVLPSFTAGQQGAVPCDGSGRPYVVTVPSANNVPTYLQAVSAGGATVYRAINAAGSAMAANVKAGSGMVYGYEACNSGSAAAYLRLFAVAGAPTVGTSVPQVSKLVAAGSCQTMTTSIGLSFSTGIAVDVTSGSLADADTATLATASQMSVEIYYK